MLKETSKKATLYRMVMEDHLCPYGLKSKWLLKRKGLAVDDNWLTTREETEAFKARHDVETTPQTWIGNVRVGGYSDLRVHFGLDDEQANETSYQPVIAVFATAMAIAVGISGMLLGNLFTVTTAEWFVSISMTILAMLKLQDVEQFSTMFLNYDLLARRWVPYAYIYPFGEFAAGVLMTAHALPWLSIPIAAFIGTVGAISVFKAVWIDKRELKCACVGGSSNVPLGFISLSENLAMMAMAGWMLAKNI